MSNSGNCRLLQKWPRVVYIYMAFSRWSDLLPVFIVLKYECWSCLEASFSKASLKKFEIFFMELRTGLLRHGVGRPLPLFIGFRQFPFYPPSFLSFSSPPCRIFDPAGGGRELWNKKKGGGKRFFGGRGEGGGDLPRVNYDNTQILTLFNCISPLSLLSPFLSPLFLHRHDRQNVVDFTLGSNSKTNCIKTQQTRCSTKINQSTILLSRTHEHKTRIVDLAWAIL